MTDFPAIPLALEKSTLGIGHVVIGHLQYHIEFLETVVGGDVEVANKDRVDDLSVTTRLSTDRPFIWVIPSETSYDLARDTRAKVQTWEAKPVQKRSSSIRALVRYAASTNGLGELDKERLNSVCDRVVDTCGEDGMPEAMIWATIGLLYEAFDPLQDAKNWKHPWETPWGWGKKVPLPLRLNVLYRDLAGWVFAKDDNKKGAERLGVTPSKFRWLQTLQLDAGRVERALLVLSSWRGRQDAEEGYRVALRVGLAFERS